MPAIIFPIIKTYSRATTIRKGADTHDEQNEIKQIFKYNGHGAIRTCRCKSCCNYIKQIRRDYNEQHYI
ncbi:hypothetical protein bcgnr5373_45330 [Bacillus cereus]